MSENQFGWPSTRIRQEHGENAEIREVVDEFLKSAETTPPRVGLVFEALLADEPRQGLNLMREVESLTMLAAGTKGVDTEPRAVPRSPR
jgi:hypothetical protein